MVKNDESKEEEEVVLDGETLPERQEVDVETGEKLLQDKIQTLRKKLATCEEERRTHLEELARTRADFLNSKRRLEDQFVRDRERATDSILFELIALTDSFDTAMMDRELWNSIDQKWRGGIEAIHTQLLSILKSNNVVTIDPLGSKFNPEEHEAVSNTIVSDATQADIIVTVLQKGFRRNEAVIRPARVIVGVSEEL